MEIYLMILGAYMLLGLSLFEWAWIKVKVIRDVNEERDSKYPAYRRVDA